MDPLTTSIDFDQSFSSLLKAELAKQQNLLDLDDSLSLDHTHTQHLRENIDNTESTTHYIKVYRDQLETLQRDNFSLKLQLFYFQRAFESAGISNFPQFSGYQEEFIDLEKELVENRRALTKSNETISHLTNLNKELQRRLDKFDKRSSGTKEKIDELSFQFKEKVDALDKLTIEYNNVFDENRRQELRFEEFQCYITKLEKEVSALNAKCGDLTQNNIGIAEKLAGAEDNVILLHDKNSKIIEFAKPLAQKLQETQEELETVELRNKELKMGLETAARSNTQFSHNHSNLEEQLSNLSEKKGILAKKCDELLNAKGYLEQTIEKQSAQKAAFLCKLKDYEEDIKSLNQQLIESSQLLETIKRDDAIKESKIVQMSHAEESLLQSRQIILTLENRIVDLMKKIHKLQNGNSNKMYLNEISVLNSMLLEAKSKYSQKESLCHKFEEQNYLLQTEINEKGGMKSDIHVLKNEIETSNIADSRDMATQTKISKGLSSNTHRNSRRETDISNLQHQILCLESERDFFRCETEDMEALKTKLMNFEQQNIELNLQIQSLKFLRSFIDELDIVNIKSDQMSTQLKIVQTLSKDSGSIEVCKETDVFLSEFLELIDHLRASKDSLTISLANEERLEYILHNLREHLEAVQIEKSKILSRLCVSDKTISELKHELDMIKSSFLNLLQNGDRHINKSDSLLILNPSTSNFLQENLISKNNPEYGTLLLKEDLTKKLEIPRSSSTPCIRTEFSSDYLSEDNPKCHLRESRDPKANNIPPNSGNDDDIFEDIPEVIVPDKLEVRKALDSNNLSIFYKELFMIYKELLTTQKYLSRAKRYTLN